MKRILIAGALILASTSAFAGSPFRDFGTTYQFRSSAARTDAVIRAYYIREVEKGLQGFDTRISTSNSKHVYDGMTQNYNNSTSIGNWSSVNCSGEGGYCNVGQDNEDSVQNSQVNTGGTVDADQVGDDQKNGGGYAN